MWSPHMGVTNRDGYVEMAMFGQYVAISQKRYKIERHSYCRMLIFSYWVELETSNLLDKLT